MTLAEDARVNRVPPSYLLERLRLPPDTPLGESVRNLRGQYKFQMDELRGSIAEYQSRKAIASGGRRPILQFQEKGIGNARRNQSLLQR